MNQPTNSFAPDFAYPVVLLPKTCTILEAPTSDAENIFVDVNINSMDTEGNPMCIYNGLCNIKLIDSFDGTQLDRTADVEFSIDNQNYLQNIDVFNQNQVWIDPDRSPNVYNYNAIAPQEYAIHTKTSRITVEKHSTFITQNVYNCEESIRYSPVAAEEYEHKKFKKLPTSEQMTQQMLDNNLNLYENDEFQCGVFLSQLPEEILNEKENKEREERRFREKESHNDALKQLMSPDIQSMSKQTKTILFLGHDSQCGQTIQNIAVNDPSVECGGSVAESEVSFDEFDDHAPQSTHKKYQCDNCKQIFDQMAAFKQHMIFNHKVPNNKTSLINYLAPVQSEVRYLCTECGKTLKSQDKFEIHCNGHGNPEVECDMCHKVFASKFTLRVHKRIHSRNHSCTFCIKSFKTEEDLLSHINKQHVVFSCDKCEYITENREHLVNHLILHEPLNEATIEATIESNSTDFTEPYLEEEISESDLIMPAPEIIDAIREDYVKDGQEGDMDLDDPNSVIAKVMSNNIFLLHSKKVKKNTKTNKICDVCFKKFDRIGDLKRHLIEHVIRSTLAKTPVKDGTLNIQCEVCQVETFTKIDKYKAHLREHAKLTLYKCTFCDKSFSDSSNFSKHKKIHGVSYLQCDLCNRKFNSKKMIAQHMEYHNKNSPIDCEYCGKLFHFESMLNKHVKSAHTKELNCKFRCRFCHDYFRSLKDKWDHEWSVHNIRKIIVDCLICDSKFRKYSELKRHCMQAHDMNIPPAKMLLRSKRKRV